MEEGYHGRSLEEVMPELSLEEQAAVRLKEVGKVEPSSTQREEDQELETDTHWDGWNIVMRDKGEVSVER